MAPLFHENVYGATPFDTDSVALPSIVLLHEASITLLETMILHPVVVEKFTLDAHPEDPLHLTVHS